LKTTIDLSHLRPLDHKTAMQIAANENALFGELLRGLEPEEWELPTDCDLWAVRDIVAHLIGWGEALTSPREGIHQFVSSRKLVREFGGSTNAQNQIQVEDRRGLNPDELYIRYERASRRLLALRHPIGIVGRAIPWYNPLLGGFATFGFVADAIFTRDTFMHRIDISRAAGREMTMGLHQDLLVADIVRDWARRTRIPVRVELSGPGGGSFSSGEPEVTVRTSAIDFCRFMARRISEDELEVEGDPARAQQALSIRAPF
jgi:uncharacterized protein (TIGR03083 family)